jgi:hypothetical protein
MSESTPQETKHKHNTTFPPPDCNGKKKGREEEENKVGICVKDKDQTICEYCFDSHSTTTTWNVVCGCGYNVCLSCWSKFQQKALEIINFVPMKKKKNIPTLEFPNGRTVIFPVLKHIKNTLHYGLDPARWCMHCLSSDGKEKEKEKEKLSETAAAAEKIHIGQASKTLDVAEPCEFCLSESLGTCFQCDGGHQYSICSHCNASVKKKLKRFLRSKALQTRNLRTIVIPICKLEICAPPIKAALMQHERKNKKLTVEKLRWTNVDNWCLHCLRWPGDGNLHFDYDKSTWCSLMPRRFSATLTPLTPATPATPAQRTKTFEKRVKRPAVFG